MKEIDRNDLIGRAWRIASSGCSISKYQLRVFKMWKAFSVKSSTFEKKQLHILKRVRKERGEDWHECAVGETKQLLGC